MNVSGMTGMRHRAPSFDKIIVVTASRGAAAKAKPE
jgi:hypothetical protein